MSALSKTLMAATVVVPLLFAIHQANEANRLQSETQLLHETSGKLISSEQPSPRESISRKGGRGREPSSRPDSAAREAIRKRMEMAQVGMHPDSFDHSLFEKGGKGVTAGAAKAAGLNREEQAAVSEILTKTWSVVSDDFARRAILVEDDSDEKSGRTVYMVAARPDRGREFNEQLVADLENAVGISKLEILIKGYQRTHSLGAFGAQDVRLEFTAGKKEFSFAYLNPLDGEGTYFGSQPLEKFQEDFGDSFEVPEAKR